MDVVDDARRAERGPTTGGPSGASQTRMLIGNASKALIAHLAGRGAVVVASFLLARGLTTSGFAAYSYFRETVVLISAYAALGLGLTATRGFAASESGVRAATRVLPGALSSLSIVASLFAAILALALPGAWVTAGLDFPRWLLALAVGLAALEVVPVNAVVGLERYRALIVLSFIYGGAVTLSAWLAIAHGHPQVAMLGLCVGSLSQVAGAYFVIWRRLGWHRMKQGMLPTVADVRSVVRIAGPMFLTTLMVVSGNWLVGRIMLDGRDGERIFALYTIGRQWYGLGLLIPARLSRVLLPRLVRLLGGDVRDEATALVRKSIVVGSISAVAVALVVVPLGPWVISFYGPEYGGSPWLIAGFIALAILTVPARSLTNPIVADDGQVRVMAFTAGWLVLLLTVAAVGLSRGMGVWAGVLAQAVATGFLGAIAYLDCRRRRLV